MLLLAFPGTLFFLLPKIIDEYHMFSMLGNHDYKVVICVNVSMNGCLAFCVGPVIGWRSVKGVSCFSPYETWDRSSPPDFEPDRLEGDRYG